MKKDGRTKLRRNRLKDSSKTNGYLDHELQLIPEV